jgi:hypothetical protein
VLKQFTKGGEVIRQNGRTALQDELTPLKITAPSKALGSNPITGQLGNFSQKMASLAKERVVECQQQMQVIISIITQRQA